MKKPGIIPKIATERLFLRELTLMDAPFVELLAGDAKIAETALHIPHPYEEGLAERWIMDIHRKFSLGKEVVFGITSKPFESIIGAVGLVLNERFNHAELGYWVGKPYWGKRYATEAVAACVKYGFEELELNRIFANCLADNEASKRILLGIGMQEEGCLRSHVHHWNKYQDLIYYGLLRDEYFKLTGREA